MANAKLSLLGAQIIANAAAVATAVAGGVTTADCQALGNLLNCMAVNPGASIPLISLSTPTGVNTTALTPS